MRIRKAEILDAPRIAEIHVRSWQVAYKDLLPADFLAALDVRKREAMWRVCLAGNGLLFVVEDEHSEIVGFLNVGISRDKDLPEATELAAIYLDPKFYGLGIGSAFWKCVEKSLSSERVYLWVLSANRLGIAFYEKNGFHPDGEKKHFTIGDQRFEESRYQKHLNVQLD